MDTRLAEAHARQLARSFEGWTLLDAAQQAVDEQRWPWLAAMGQPHRGWGPGALYCLARVNGLIAEGHVGLCRVELGTEPHPDRARSANAAALTEAPWPFTFTLADQNNDPNGDGTAEWCSPIRLDAYQGGEPGVVTVESRGSLPLEVGRCEPFTVLMHLARSGGVARWPYGSDSVWMLVELERGSLAETNDRLTMPL